MLAFCLPLSATGRISAVANTQSSTEVGCRERNSLRIAGDSPCVTPSTSPLHNSSLVAGSVLGYSASGVSGSISSNCDKPRLANMSTLRCSKSSTSYLSNSI